MKDPYEDDRKRWMELAQQVTQHVFDAFAPEVRKAIESGDLRKLREVHREEQELLNAQLAPIAKGLAALPPPPIFVESSQVS